MMIEKVPDCYDYPDDLYCIKCNDYVDAVLEDRVEHMTQNGKPVEIPWKAAVCPKCGSTLCERDLDYGILRQARKDGLFDRGEADPEDLMNPINGPLHAGPERSQNGAD